MDESQALSDQDLQDLHQIMGMLPDTDPRHAKVSAFLSQQLQMKAAQPQPPKTAMSTGEGPIAQGMTSFETQLSQMPSGMWNLLKQSWNDPKFEPVGTFAQGLNPVQKVDPGTPAERMDWGATAANVLPWLTDLGGRGIGKSPALSLARGAAGAASEHIPSIQRAQQAFGHLDTGLRDLTPASEPKFAPQVERISQTAQQVADRFNATKLRSVPPIISKFIERLNDTENLVSWPELRQFKTDLNTLVWDREIPSQFKGPLKNLVKTLDQGLRAGADLRGQGDVFAKANADYRQSSAINRNAGVVGNVAGRTAGAGIGYGIGSTMGHPWLGAALGGKYLGAPAGESIAGSLARSITGRDVPPQSFPDIPASKISTTPPESSPKVSLNRLASDIQSLGYSKADALERAKAGIAKHPTDLNAATTEAMRSNKVQAAKAPTSAPPAPDRLADSQANSLYGKDYADLTPEQKAQVIRANKPTGGER